MRVERLIILVMLAIGYITSAYVFVSGIYNLYVTHKLLYLIGVIASAMTIYIFCILTSRLFKK